jgi:hypothetical protein
MLHVHPGQLLCVCKHLFSSRSRELDFFHAHADVRKVNQASLAQLNSLLDAVENNKLDAFRSAPVKLKFFTREPTSTLSSASLSTATTSSEFKSFEVAFEPPVQRKTEGFYAFKKRISDA